MLKTINIGLAGVIIGMIIFLALPNSEIKLKGGAGGQYARTCTTNTVSPVSIGNQESKTVLSSYGLRAWARIAMPSNATNTVYVSFDEGAASTLNSGLPLGQLNATTTTNYIDFGLNTDFPYTGAVTALTNVGTTTVLVTECRY